MYTKIRAILFIMMSICSHQMMSMDVSAWIKQHEKEMQEKFAKEKAEFDAQMRTMEEQRIQEQQKVHENLNRSMQEYQKQWQQEQVQFQAKLAASLKDNEEEIKRKELEEKKHRNQLLQEHEKRQQTKEAVGRAMRVEWFKQQEEAKKQQEEFGIATKAWTKNHEALLEKQKRESNALLNEIDQIFNLDDPDKAMEKLEEIKKKHNIN